MNEKFEELLKIIEKEHKEEKDLTLNSRILIVDCLNNFIRIWVVMPTTNEDGRHVGGIVGFLHTLGVSIRALRPTRIFIVLDGKDSSKRRKKIFPDYKENRGSGTRLNRAYKWENEEEERKQMQYQLLRIVQYLKNLPITFICIDSIEADDSISCLIDICKNKKELQELFIISSDKDFYQLIDDRVKVWNPIKKEVVTKENVLTRFNVSPNNFALYKSMVGDKSDNVPGIKGLGIKNINKHFSFLNEDKQYTVDNVLDYSHDHTDDARAFRLLSDNINQYILNYKLMKLSNDNIPKSSVLKITELFNKKITEINLIHIYELIKHDKIWNSFKNINEWITTNFSILNKFAKES